MPEWIREHVKKMATDNRDAWARNVSNVVKIGEPAIPYLMETLDHEDYDIRRGAITALGNLKAEQSIPKMEKLLSKGTKPVHEYELAHALGDIGTKEAMEVLRKNLRSDQVWGRPHVLSVLGAEKYTPAIPQIMEILNRSYSDVFERSRAFRALRRIGTTESEDLLIKILNKEVDWKSSPLTQIRAEAAVTLGSIGSKKAIPHLIKALEDTDTEIKGNAAHGLGMTMGEKSIPYLEKHMDHEDKDVREGVAKGLWSAGEKALPLLFKMRDNEQKRKVPVDNILNMTLQRIEHWEFKGSEAVIPIIGKGLQSPEEDVRKAVKHAFEHRNLWNKSVYPYLKEAMKCDSPEARHDATIRLKEFKDPDNFKEFANVLGDDYRWVKQIALDAMWKISTEKTVPYAKKATLDINRSVRHEAYDMLNNKHRYVGTHTISKDEVWETCEKAFNHSNPLVRKDGLNNIAMEFDGEKAMPYVIKGLEDSDKNVSSCAFKALNDINPSNLIDILINAHAKANNQQIRKEIEGKLERIEEGAKNVN